MAALSPDELERYARHIVLKEIGGPGQQRLKAASVAIVGVGGLGGPAALYLAAAGVGRIGLIDPDVVSLSNLQRQIQFRTQDLGRLKVDAAADGLTETNPHVAIDAVAEALTPATAAARLAGYDVVLDGVDRFDTRFAVNAACVGLDTPLVSGAVGPWTGQVGVFHPGPERDAPCYQCLVPAPPPDAEDCARHGVVGALTGLVGARMALEAIKTITGAGRSLRGRLWVFDALAGEGRTIDVPPDPACPVCGD